MSNHVVLDKSIGHLTYAEQRNVVKKLAKLEKRRAGFKRYFEQEYDFSEKGTDLFRRIST